MCSVIHVHTDLHDSPLKWCEMNLNDILTLKRSYSSKTCIYKKWSLLNPVVKIKPLLVHMAMLRESLISKCRKIQDK